MAHLPWNNPDNIISPEVEKFTRRVIDFILVLIFLIGGPGNVINMAVFYRQGLQDRINVCLFALALGDELYLLVMMCHMAEQVHLQFTSEDRYGPMVMFMTTNYLTGFSGVMYASQILSAIIASERCYCVLRPLKYQTVIRTRTMTVIIVFVYVVVISLYSVVSFRFYIGCVRDPISGAAFKTTIVNEVYEAYEELVDILDGVFFGAGLPGVVMVVVITTTIITVVKLRQVVTWRTETSSSISPREVALTKMLVGTSILFIVCVFPFAVIRVCWLIFPDVNIGRSNHNLFKTSLWWGILLSYINSSLNIVVYYAMGSRYRETFWELFSRNVKKRKRQEARAIRS
ncbi:galanin receptor 2b-like [Babylonia areolata]|uniref:galanin receptor 2b-like n=1 Tax=Babylonia areolata TaxID=304850 RepID=UPI003FD27E42